MTDNTSLIEAGRAAQPVCNHSANSGLCHDLADALEAKSAECERVRLDAMAMEDNLNAALAGAEARSVRQAAQCEAAWAALKKIEAKVFPRPSEAHVYINGIRRIARTALQQRSRDHDAR